MWDRVKLFNVNPGFKVTTHPLIKGCYSPCTQPKMSHNNVLSHPRDSFSYGSVIGVCPALNARSVSTHGQSYTFLSFIVVIEFLRAVTLVKRCYNCPVGCNIHNNKCYQNRVCLLSRNHSGYKSSPILAHLIGENKFCSFEINAFIWSYFLKQLSEI